MRIAFILFIVSKHTQKKLLEVSDLEETQLRIFQLDSPTAGRKLPQDLLASYCIYSYDLIQYHVLLMKLIKIREAYLIQYI